MMQLPTNRPIVFSFGFIVLAAASVLAQDRSLEGTTVTLKIDMPASSDGVDVRPLAPVPVDFRKVAGTIHDNGVGVHVGQSIMITKVILKKDHIEVHLGGGGFGTLADRFATAAANAPVVPYEDKSRREKDLEQDLKYMTDADDRRAAKRELDDLRRDRYVDNARNAATNAQTRQMAQANVLQQRASAGSRFNIRYSDGIPPDATTSEGIRKALSKYVNFGEAPPAPEPSAAPAPSASRSAISSSSTGLRKGLTIVQTEQILGPAAKVSQKNEGAIEMTVREYSTADGQQITTDFVGGVLVDYKITPR